MEYKRQLQRNVKSIENTNRKLATISAIKNVFRLCLTSGFQE